MGDILCQFAASRGEVQAKRQIFDVISFPVNWLTLKGERTSKR